MNNYSQDIIKKVKALGIYQIAGGILGIGFTLWLLTRTSIFSNLLLLLIVILAFTFYLFSIFCGLQCFKKIKKALFYSKINQLIQVAAISMFGYAYEYVSGIYLYIGFDLTNSFLLNFNIGVSTWQININSDSPSLLVKVNLVAIFLVVFIEGLLKKIKASDELAQVAVLGEVEKPANIE